MSTVISCLPPCNKKKAKRVVEKVVPFSISEKRERVTAWWDDICSKVHQRQVTKSRNQMHKDLEKQLELMRQDMDAASDASPASTGMVVNKTATTSVTLVDDDQPSSSAATTAVASQQQKFKTTVPIGMAFDDFYNKTRAAQGKALLKYNQNAKRQEQGRENRQRNYGGNLTINKQQQQRNEIQQREEENQQRQSRTPTYQSSLAPLEEDNEGEESNKEETVTAAPQAQKPDNNPSHQDSSSSSEDGESFYSIPEHTSSPTPPTSTIAADLNRFLTDFQFGTNRLSSTEQLANQRPVNSTRASFIRSIDSSFGLTPSSSSSSFGHRTDPVVERHLPTKMGAYIEGPHSSIDDSSFENESNKHTRTSQGHNPLPSRIALTTAATLHTQPVAAQGEMVQVIPRKSAFKPQGRQRNNNNIQDGGRPPYAHGFPPNVVGSAGNIHLDVIQTIQDMDYFNHLEYIRLQQEEKRKKFRIDFGHEITHVIQENNRKLFKNNKDFLETYQFVKKDDGGGVIGDGVNGGVRVVYKVSHAKRQQSGSRVSQFAIKKIKVGFPTREYRDAILTEIYIMDRARSQAHLMSFTDLFYFNDTLRIMMERMTCDLTDFMLTLRRPMPQLLAIHILTNVVKGLYFLHYDLGYFHGDIKPENILLSAKGEVKLTDFGFSSPCGVAKSGRCGTEDYMAPEVFGDQDYNEKSDLWSLGITLISMLNHGLPAINMGDFLSADFVVIFTAFGLLFKDREIHRFIRPLFEHCLAKDPRERCTIAELDDYLEKYFAVVPKPFYTLLE